LFVRASHIHDNGWNGLWCDFCDGPSTAFVVTDSIIERNGAHGIHWEVSGGTTDGDFALIANNTIQDNNRIGVEGAAGVSCSDCADLEVVGNTFGGNGGLAVHILDVQRATWPGIRDVLIQRNVLEGDVVQGCSIRGVLCRANGGPPGGASRTAQTSLTRRWPAF
jgi:hypothetical protein